MARYKNYCYEQGKMIPISFQEQVLPGTFEYTLSYLIDHELGRLQDAEQCQQGVERHQSGADGEESEALEVRWLTESEQE